MLKPHEFLIPPYRFGQVENQLFRGGYPKERNFKFLQRLKLTTIISLIPDEPTEALASFCNENSIKHLVIKVSIPEENVTIEDKDVSQCLQIITDNRELPLYYHCADGSNVTGLLTMCLRKLQLWKLPSIELEFLRFEKNQEIIPEESDFVRSYNGGGLILNNPYALWLWPHKLLQISNDPNKLPFAKSMHPTLLKVKLYKRKAEPAGKEEATQVTNIDKSLTQKSLADKLKINLQEDKLNQHDQTTRRPHRALEFQSGQSSKESDTSTTKLSGLESKNMKSSVLSKALDDISTLKRVGSEATRMSLHSRSKSISRKDLNEEKSISESPSWFESNSPKPADSSGHAYRNKLPSVQVLKASLSLGTENIAKNSIFSQASRDSDLYSSHSSTKVSQNLRNNPIGDGGDVRNATEPENREVRIEPADELNPANKLRDMARVPKLGSSLGTSAFIDYIYVLNDSLQPINKRNSIELSTEMKYHGLSPQLMALALEGLGM